MIHDIVIIVFIVLEITIAYSHYQDCNYSETNISNKIKIGYILDYKRPMAFDQLLHNDTINSIFSFHYLTNNDVITKSVNYMNCYFQNNSDMVINSVYPNDIDQVFKGDSSNTSSLINCAISKPNVNIIKIWGNKLTFKIWMINNGMKQWVPSLMTKDNATFPLFLKATNLDGSNGIKNINNINQLKSELSKIPKSNVNNILLEELLDGMGPLEGDLFGSAYNGELVSLKCRIEDLSSNGHASIRSNNNFIKLPPGSRYNPNELCSVSSKLLEVIVNMMRLGNYSGAFCLGFKMDSSKQIKFYDMNPRICGTLFTRHDFFISAYLPLAFKIKESLMKSELVHLHPMHPLIGSSYDNKGWYYNKTLIQMNERELHFAKNGIDPSLRDIDDIVSSLNKGHK